jgi:hypothetical protein
MEVDVEVLDLADHEARKLLLTLDLSPRKPEPVSHGSCLTYTQSHLASKLLCM